MQTLKNQTDPLPGNQNQGRAKSGGDAAANALPLYEAEAKDRLSKAGGDNKAGVEKIPQVVRGKARDKAAKAAGVNPRYVSPNPAVCPERKRTAFLKRKRTT